MTPRPARVLEPGGGARAAAWPRAEHHDRGADHAAPSVIDHDQPSTTIAAGAVAALTAADFDAAGTCRLVPEKTAGPFPLDRQFDRRDVTEGLPGQPLRLGLRVVDAHCDPVPDAAVEIWHCDATGDYSAFRDGGGGKDAAAGTTFLRGTQPATADGIVEFATLYPGWYRGPRGAHPPARPPRRRDRAHVAAVLPRRLHRRRVRSRAVRAVRHARTPATPRTASRATRRPRARCSRCATPTTGRGAGTLGLLNLGVAA